MRTGNVNLVFFMFKEPSMCADDCVVIECLKGPISTKNDGRTGQCGCGCAPPPPPLVCRCDLKPTIGRKTGGKGGGWG